MKKIFGLILIMIMLVGCKPKQNEPIRRTQSGFRYEAVDTSLFNEETFDGVLVFGDYAFDLPLTLSQFHERGYEYYYVPQQGGKNTDDAIIKAGDKLTVRFTNGGESEIAVEIENFSDTDATITQCIEAGRFIIQDELSMFRLRGMTTPTTPEEHNEYYELLMSKMGQPSELWFATDKQEGYGYVYDYGDYILVFNFFESPQSEIFTYRGLVYLPHGMWGAYSKQFPDGVLQ